MHVYKVVADVCLEKCLIAKHSFYSVEYQIVIDLGDIRDTDIFSVMIFDSVSLAAWVENE